MRSFSYYVPTEIIFGADTEKRTAELVQKYGGTRVLLVTGGGSVVRSGLLDRVTALLDGAGVAHELLSGVRPNPRLSFAREGVKQALAMKADLILAVGGGSVIDTAKAVAHGAANPDTDIWEFWSGSKKLARTLPVGVILTLPASGSESSNSAVLTNEETSVKRGLSTDFNRPAFAILDPKLAATLPPYQAACGVTDIMMHTLDRYFNPVGDDETTDELAEALLRVVVRNGIAVVKDPADEHAMSEIMWCGSLSHNGLTGLGGTNDFAPHQLGHALSAKFDAAHGASLASIWASWARHVFRANPARFARYAKNVWEIDASFSAEEAALSGIAATEAYFQALGMPAGLPALVGRQDEAGLDDLADRCSYGRSRTIGSFMKLGWEDMRAIYAAANDSL